MQSALRYELLAPAGDETCLHAAVENGADSVYFGLNDGFNARARAANFDRAALPDIFAYLHRRDVKGYLTLNTLAFTDELPMLEMLVREVVSSGVDALLIQDLGLARLVHAICPGLPIHASTQMTLTSAECLAVASELGIQRVVLPRELSLDEIRQISRQTAMPLEAFVHGALCVAYSGQCLTSESLGGRSANRGQCAQACRLPYDLICDEKDVDLDAVKYLLSPQDLAAYALIPELMAAGVTAFKIEGRLKTPEYVANITRHYRQAIDAAAADHPIQFSKDEIREMELSFSRGFSVGWLRGCDHKALVPGLSSAKRGVLLGTIRRILSHGVEVDLTNPVAAGDGVVFDGGRETGEEQGGRVYAVRRRGLKIAGTIESGIVELEFGDRAIDHTRLSIGQAIWKTDDPKLTAKLRRTFTCPDPIRKVHVEMTVRVVTGQPLNIVCRTATGHTAEVASSEPLARARTRPVTETFLREQLSRLGHTVYELQHLEAHIAGEPMAPLSVVSELRRRLIAELDRQSAEITALSLTPKPVLEVLRSEIPLPVAAEDDHSPRLRVLCRNLEQLGTAARLDVTGLYADFQDLRDYREAVSICHGAKVPIYLAPPRIQKPEEFGIFRMLEKFVPDGILARNLSGLRFCRDQQIPVVADYSLNGANELTAQWLVDQGAQRVTASYDLNRDQLLELLSAAPPAWLEVVIHQHMPLFHMEHCVFCAVLSPGTNKTNCGRPCDHHQVRLRDRVGMEHPLKADVGCRNTLFNAMAQSSAEVVPELLGRGVREFRIELLDESPDETRQVVCLYRDLLAGRKTGQEVWRQLRAANRVGVTRGTLEDRRNPLAIL